MVNLSQQVVRELEAQDAERADEFARNEKVIADLIAKNKELAELRQATRKLLGANAAQPAPTTSATSNGTVHILHAPTNEVPETDIAGKTLGQAIEMAMARVSGPAWPAQITEILTGAGYAPNGKSSAANLVSTEMARLYRLGRLQKTDSGYVKPRHQ